MNSTREGIGLRLEDFGDDLDNRKKKVAQMSIRAYHECARYMTKTDQERAATDLLEFVFQKVGQPTQHRVTRRTNTNNKVNLWIMDCLFPTLLESVREKYADMITTMNDNYRFPYPAYRIPKSVSGFDAPFPKDDCYIRGTPTYVLPLKLDDGWSLKPNARPPQRPEGQRTEQPADKQKNDKNEQRTKKPAGEQGSDKRDDDEDSDKPLSKKKKKKQRTEKRDRGSEESNSIKSFCSLTPKDLPNNRLWVHADDMFLEYGETWGDIAHTAIAQGKLVADQIIACNDDPLNYNYTHLKDEEKHLKRLYRDKMQKDKPVEPKHGKTPKIVKLPGDTQGPVKRKREDDQSDGAPGSIGFPPRNPFGQDAVFNHYQYQHPPIFQQPPYQPVLRQNAFARQNAYAHSTPGEADARSRIANLHAMIGECEADIAVMKTRIRVLESTLEGIHYN